MSLKGNDLKEFNYCMSLLIFQVKPSKQNSFDRFSKWYDGNEKNADWGKTYIIMELRDKDDFPVSICFHVTKELVLTPFLAM